VSLPHLSRLFKVLLGHADLLCPVCLQAKHVVGLMDLEPDILLNEMVSESGLRVALALAAAARRPSSIN
jgi:hypothetical protein